LTFSSAFNRPVTKPKDTAHRREMSIHAVVFRSFMVFRKIVRQFVCRLS